ncbi:MAG: tetratricopeptide repeat protein [Planctomycetes bacterium]|nr:tetratricopeptide repeat protein [Planctomycetota bacterium]
MDPHRPRAAEAPAAGPARAHLGFVCLTLAVVLAATLVAFDEAPGLWGLGGWGDARLPFLVAAAAALLVLVVVRPLAARLGAAVLAVPLPVRGIGPFVVGLLVVPVFYALRTSVLVGDWRLVLERLALDLYYPSSLWTDYLFRLAQAAGGRSGFFPDDAIALVSAASGGVFVAFLLRLAGELGDTPGRRRFLFWFPLVSGATLIFFGHLEAYGPVAAGLVVFLDLLVRARRGRLHLALPGFALGAAVCLHGVALLWLPPYLVAVVRWSATHRLRRLLLSVLLFLLPVAVSAAVLFFVHWGARPPDDPALRHGTFLGAAGQGLITPLTRAAASEAHVYVLAEARHWIDRWNVLLRLAPIALVLALPALGARGRRRFPRDPIRADLHDHLALTLCLSLLWLAVHNLSYPAAHDWDLFAPIGFLLALLAASAPGVPHPERTAGWLALAAFTALPWWATAIAPPAYKAAAAHYALARVYQEIGGPQAEAAFLHHLDRAASRGTRPHRLAVKTLGVYYASRGQPQAERWLQLGADAYPCDAEIRANLGLYHYSLKKYAPALEHLRAAVALAPDAPLFHRDLARLLFEIQDHEEAYAHFRRAVELRPDDRELVDDALRAAWKVNRPREGLAFLARLHEHHPEDREILERLFELEKQAGSLEKARHYQQKLIELASRRRDE